MTKKKVKELDSEKEVQLRQIYSEKRLLGIWKESSKQWAKELEKWMESKQFLESEIQSQDKRFSVIEELLRKELAQVEEDNKELELQKKESELLFKKSLSELKNCSLSPHENENLVFNREELDRMRDDKLNLETRLKKLKDVKQAKKALEDEMRQLEQSLEEAVLSKNFLLANKEKERIKENEWNKKEMIKKIQEADSSLQKMKKKEIETTKKLSILQNFQLNMELDSHSHKIDKLIHENKKLQSELNQLFLVIGSFEGVEDDLNARIKRMEKKCSNLETQIGRMETKKRALQQQERSTRVLFDNSREQFETFQNKKVRLKRRIWTTCAKKKSKSTATWPNWTSRSRASGARRPK